MSDNEQEGPEGQGQKVNVNMATLTFKRSEKMIKSFVFFDLETTDLIKGSKYPKITELAMVAISRDDLKVPQQKLPRILSKVVIPVCPNAEIPKIVTQITKLSNKLLENCNLFDSDVYWLVIHFLRRLEQPICFVAHNGKAFDYPIILKEFRNIDAEMPNEILAIDSIDVFRNYFSDKRLLKRQKLEEEQEKSDMLERYDSLLKDSWDDAVSAALDGIETSTSFDEGVELAETERNQEMYSQMQRINEKTPESQIMKPDQIINTCPSKMFNPQLLVKPTNFKLTNLSKHMLSSPAINEHYAEDDCISLIRCASQIGEDFIEFADKHAIPLISYERNI